MALPDALGSLLPGQPETVVPSRVPITLARDQEREFQCPGVDEKPNALEFRCGSQGCMAGLHNAFRSDSS
jgi:hypothetical protein